ncbi:MAG TPA: UDP-3-O-(3-hydroxymyristoyl)glucosamine N-acyltransferase [Magnetospirillaceae bacterium]|jgi:UDP-3-O-[3-hydroxymyristoyl] glucosamine N-acyltransferase
MADPRFFANVGPFTLGDLARRCGADLKNGADAGKRITDVAPLDKARPEDISFLDNRKFVGDFEKSRAGACVINPAMAERAPESMALLLAPDPYRAYAKLARTFYPAPAPEPWISPRAYVDPEALVGEGSRIEPGAVIGARAEIGLRCHIDANAVIGIGVVLGDDCIVGPGATVTHALIGDRVNIYAGVRIGQDGFGFAMGAEGHLKVPQLGRVLIDDDVEIGANTTIDRGASSDTVIGAGTKIDNLVQIGHNVQVGRGCVIVAQAGVSGSTRLDDFVVLAGQVGLAGHIRIGAGAQIGAQAGVMQDVEPGARVGGSPSVPVKEWLRHNAILRRLARREDLD